ncbi:hypothetical protein GJ744_010530 [Endocarpon pusillum]|uniref:Uncharacterized protein n=1 Tax=Endocarpon pusillum TaxID=364733 RepID=A0A8H7ARQ6_9EURO|nr:hypothetical protein GJ744_010530 [Endocarpon pusillum]
MITFLGLRHLAPPPPILSLLAAPTCPPVPLMGLFALELLAWEVVFGRGVCDRGAASDKAAATTAPTSLPGRATPATTQGLSRIGKKRRRKKEKTQ